MPDTLTFADGLIGLPDLRRFAAREMEDVPFLLLDSLDDVAYGFVCVDADVLRAGLAADLRRAGGLQDEHQVLVLISIHGEPAKMTANLAGPLAVDPATGAGRQLVLEGDEFPLRAPVTEVA
jgi:flagellar assembly factor FliW